MHDKMTTIDYEDIIGHTSWYFGDPSLTQYIQELDDSLTVASSDGCLSWFERQVTEVETNMTADHQAFISER